DEQQKRLAGSGDHNKNRSKKVFVKDGALILYDLKSNNSKQILELGDRISDPQFLIDENLVSFNMDNNLYVYNLDNGTLEKKTNIRSGDEQDKEQDLGTKDDWI